jgi:hypothetical protein
VAVVRQTDTAALRKASKGTGKTASGGGGSSSGTFSRAVAGIFTPGTPVGWADYAAQVQFTPGLLRVGTLVDEYSLAFQDLTRTSSKNSDGDVEADDGDSADDPNEEITSDAGAGDDEDVADPSMSGRDAWIAAVYENSFQGRAEGNDRMETVTEIGVAAVSIHAQRVQCRRFAGPGAVDALSDYLELLMVRTRSATVVTCKIDLIVVSCSSPAAE